MSKADPSVYLAGPITGQTFEESTAWRKHAAARLREHGIHSFSPLRGKEYLASIGKLPAVVQGDRSKAVKPDLYPLSSNKGIVTRDRFDCMGSDLVLVHLAEAQIISLGTMVELGWADAARRPIVVTMQPGNVHEHAFVLEIAGFVVPTLDDALDVTISILREA